MNGSCGYSEHTGLVRKGIFRHEKWTQFLCPVKWKIGWKRVFQPILLLMRSPNASGSAEDMKKQRRMKGKE